MCRIFSYVAAAAQSSQALLITGQTGTGKELVAHAVHAASSRSGAFVAVNVAGLDDHVFSGTLFGHVRGAFTGADRVRFGLIAQAAFGTLFLDEIGDLPEPAQRKLLRLLQEQEYYPLGSDQPRRSTVRIVAATNRDLRERLNAGCFREDLYFRLCTHHVHLPPLSARREDIPLLLERFVAEAAAALGKPAPAIPHELPGYLAAYDFPGNVRELKAMVYDAVTRHQRGTLLGKEHFLAAMSLHRPEPAPNLPHTKLLFPSTATDQLPTLKEAADALIRIAIERAEGNQGIAARYLGITRQGLNKMLKRKKLGA